MRLLIVRTANYLNRIRVDCGIMRLISDVAVVATNMGAPCRFTAGVLPIPIRYAPDGLELYRMFHWLLFRNRREVLELL
jgi:hypothetical protein